MAFHVGQHVVAVGLPMAREVFEIEARLKGVTIPVRGIVYTVRAIDDWWGTVLLRLYEIDNSHAVPRLGTIEPGFPSEAFRPLDKSRLDQFRAHLAPAPKPRVAA